MPVSFAASSLVHFRLFSHTTFGSYVAKSTFFAAYLPCVHIFCGIQAFCGGAAEKYETLFGLGLELFCLNACHALFERRLYEQTTKLLCGRR